MFRVFCFAIILAVSSNVLAQDDLLVNVKVSDMNTYESIKDAEIKVVKDNEKYRTFITDNSGEASFNLTLGYGYHLYISGKAYTTKFILMDTRGIPEEDQEGGFKYELDFSLFKKRKHFNEELMSAPLGIAKYEAASNSIEFDFGYTGERTELIEKEQERVDDLMRESFDKTVKKADALSEKGKFTKANKFYSKAFNLIPTDNYVRRKLGFYKEEDLSKPTS